MPYFEWPASAKIFCCFAGVLGFRSVRMLILSYSLCSLEPVLCNAPAFLCILKLRGCHSCTSA